MKRLARLAVACGTLNLLAVGQAFAQYQPYRPLPTSRPAVSPYLNLLRRGQDPALNYYNLVRPEIEGRNAILQLQSQTTANRQALTGLEQGLFLPTTGHRSGFMNYYSFFLNNNARGGGYAAGLGVAGRPGGAAGPVGPRMGGGATQPNPAATAAPRR
jgi:hypothetical protein